MDTSIKYDDFTRVDIRIGKIIEAEPFQRAKNPSYRLKIDFGELGTRQSSAQITHLYETRELVGRYVVAVVNFTPKNIAGFMSEVLVLGAINQSGECVLLAPERPVAPGTRIS
jgi:tRNA-binding protein